MIVTVLLVTGHFTAYTFVRPLLYDQVGVSAAALSGLLLLFGAAGIAGNFLTGLHNAKHIRRTLQTITATLAVTMLLFAGLGHGPLIGTVLIGIWGLAYGGVSVGRQTWMLQAAPQAAEPATALFVSAFNAAIALGALT